MLSFPVVLPQIAVGPPHPRQERPRAARLALTAPGTTTCREQNPSCGRRRGSNMEYLER